MYRETLEPYRINYTQYNSRIMTMKIKLHGPPLTIINQAAPQDAHKDQRLKALHYDNLRVIMEKATDAAPMLIVGDFNVRLHAREAGEERWIGPHVFGKGLGYLQDHLTEDSNRNHFLEWVSERDLWVANTKFPKPPEKLVTFAEMHNQDKDGMVEIQDSTSLERP